MTVREINEARFETALRIAATELYNEEMAALPTNGEVLRLYPLSDAHNRKMAKIFARERRGEFLRPLIYVSKKAAVIILGVIGALFGALLLNADVRAAVGRTVVKWFDGFAKFSFSGDADVSGEWVLGYLPMGYAESLVYDFAPLYIVEYVDRDGNVIVFQYAPSKVTAPSIDTEYHVYSTIMIDSVTYNIFSSSVEYMQSNIVWERDGFGFLIEGFEDTDELLKIAISATKK